MSGKLDLTVGQRVSRSMTVTAEHVRAYAEITGDHNPLHFDEAFAAHTPFGRLVAQGGITTGILHALVAEDMPGPGTVFLSQEWTFTAPVFIGDHITGSAEVLEVHDSKPVCRLRMRVVRGSGEGSGDGGNGADGADGADGGDVEVLAGEAWCYRFVVE